MLKSLALTIFIILSLSAQKRTLDEKYDKKMKEMEKSMFNTGLLTVGFSQRAIDLSALNAALTTQQFAKFGSRVSAFSCYFETGPSKSKNKIAFDLSYGKVQKAPNAAGLPSLNASLFDFSYGFGRTLVQKGSFKFSADASIGLANLAFETPLADDEYYFPKIDLKDFLANTPVKRKVNAVTAFAPTLKLGFTSTAIIPVKNEETERFKFTAGIPILLRFGYQYAAKTKFFELTETPAVNFSGLYFTFGVGIAGSKIKK